MPEFTITLPSCAKYPEPKNQITTLGPIVIVGANGSGKSRLAAWIERQEPNIRHRISAQRMLSFPDDFRGSTIEKAEGAFLYGHETFTAQQGHNKFGHKWSGHDRPIDDYQRLITLLFSEGAQVREEYVQKMAGQTTYDAPPVRKLDTIRSIWEHVLPNREILIGGHKIEARKRGTIDYFSPHEMSDGERVIFYLIGQCLCAPKGGIIILDEPELHLHPALQTRLWDAVEKERPDCLFIYITHDLEFAASRKGGVHIWLNEYTPTDKWEWDFVPFNTSLPETLLLEVLGSRTPILFVEGKPNGPDEKIYRLLYPEHHVVGVGGCEQIIHATASCRNLKSLGQLNVTAYGLIDRDGREESVITALKASGISALEWSEIENLLLHEEIIRHASAALHRDADKDVAEIKNQIIAMLASDLERIACELAGRELDRVIRSWAWKHPNSAALEESLTKHVSQVDAKKTIEACRKMIQHIIHSKDYLSALRIYPNKGLLGKASQVLGLSKYGEYVLRRVESPEGAPLILVLRKLVPSLAT